MERYFQLKADESDPGYQYAQVTTYEGKKKRVHKAVYHDWKGSNTLAQTSLSPINEAKVKRSFHRLLHHSEMPGRSADNKNTRKSKKILLMLLLVVAVPPPLRPTVKDRRKNRQLQRKVAEEEYVAARSIENQPLRGKNQKNKTATNTP